MSELGLKEGQGQDEKTPFFDSSKISDKKATEHFANVEGAAERAKQAERARIAAEKEAREVHAADIRAASEQMKKAQKAEKTSNKASGVFAGNHKWLFIIILLVAILATVGIVYYFASTSKTKEEQVEEKVESFKENCNSEIRENEYCFEALDDFEAYISNEKNLDAKVILLKNYEEYVMSEFGDAGRVKDFLDENISGEYTERNKEDLCGIYKDLYYESDNWEEYVKDCEL